MSIRSQAARLIIVEGIENNINCVNYLELTIQLFSGNISAGKSTLCRELASELGFALFLEPVVSTLFS